MNRSIHKFDNLDKNEPILGKIQTIITWSNKTDSLNRPITIKDIKFVTLKSPQKKFPGPFGSMGNSTQCL